MDDEETVRSMAKYFWQEKGDMERYTGFDEAAFEKYIPHVLHLWREYKDALRRLNAAVADL